jgi:hypothetical protein
VKSVSIFLASVFVAAGVVALHESRAHAQAQGDVAQILGAWTINKDLSDLGVAPAGRGDSGGGAGRGGGYGRGGRGGGGMHGGGGGYPRGGQGGGQTQNREDMERRIAALRDIIEAPEHITIVQSNSMIIVTTGDGRTTRLSPSGEKVKDESTGIERRTRWEGGKLVSEIRGDAGKLTETYSADAAHHELYVIVRVEANGREEGTRIFHRVYTAGAQ